MSVTGPFESECEARKDVAFVFEGAQGVGVDRVVTQDLDRKDASLQVLLIEEYVRKSVGADVPYRGVTRQDGGGDGLRAATIDALLPQGIRVGHAAPPWAPDVGCWSPRPLRSPRPRSRESPISQYRGKVIPNRRARTSAQAAPSIGVYHGHIAACSLPCMLLRHFAVAITFMIDFTRTVFIVGLHYKRICCKFQKLIFQ